MSTDSVSPLRQRMIEDMNARKLCAGTQRGHIRGCKRLAAFLKRSPETHRESKRGGLAASGQSTKSLRDSGGEAWLERINQVRDRR